MSHVWFKSRDVQCIFRRSPKTFPESIKRVQLFKSSWLLHGRTMLYSIANAVFYFCLVLGKSQKYPEGISLQSQRNSEVGVGSRGGGSVIEK